MRASFSPVPAEGESGEAPKKHIPKAPGFFVFAGKLAAGLAACGLLVLLGVFIARSSAKAPQPNVSVPGQNAPATLSDKQVQELVAKVNKHMVLPKETPQIVAIANVDQLKIDQPFFRTAQNGDELLVYTNRVILYRPSTDQVVDVAQIRPSPSASPAVSEPELPTNTPTPTKPAAYATWTPTPSQTP